MEFLRQMAEAVFLFLKDLGYFGILFGLMVEVIPSEIVLAYGGYLISEGEIKFLWALLFAVIGGTMAQLFLYWIGRYGGRPFLEKYGKYLLIKKKHLDIAESWFEKYGTGIVFSARFVPVVRHAISIPAGVAAMPLLRFTALTALASVPWSVFFMFLGMKLGESWRNFDAAAESFIWTVALLAAGAFFVYLLMMRGLRFKAGWSKMAVQTAGRFGDSHQQPDAGGMNPTVPLDETPNPPREKGWFRSPMPLEMMVGRSRFLSQIGWIGPGGVLLADQSGWSEAKDLQAYLYRAERAWREHFREQGMFARVAVVPVEAEKFESFGEDGSTVGEESVLSAVPPSFVREAGKKVRWITEPGPGQPKLSEKQLAQIRAYLITD